MNNINIENINNHKIFTITEKNIEDMRHILSEYNVLTDILIGCNPVKTDVIESDNNFYIKNVQKLLIGTSKLINANTFSYMLYPALKIKIPDSLKFEIDQNYMNIFTKIYYEHKEDKSFCEDVLISTNYTDFKILTYIDIPQLKLKFPLLEIPENYEFLKFYFIPTSRFGNFPRIENIFIIKEKELFLDMENIF